MSEQFLFPNASLGYPYANQGADYYSNLAAYNASVQKTNAYGFCFDTSEVVDEYSVCVNIMDKYYQALMMGAVDPVEYIPKVTEELKAAGMDTIIAAKQEQFDAWRAEQ